jgi:hypothetical protein
LKSRLRILLLVLALIFSAVAVGVAFRLDAPVRAAVVQSQGKGWKKSDERKFHSAVRHYGDWPWLMLYAGLALVTARALRNREWQKIIVAAMLASTVAGMIANSSRLTTGRTRPRESPKIEQGFYGPWKDGRLTIGDQAYNSFPSGHTATAFGLAWVLVMARPWLGLGGLVLAGLVGWSSIIMGTHHPSDVVVSILLSFVVAWFTWDLVRRNGDRFAVAVVARWRKFRAGRQSDSRNS